MSKAVFSGNYVDMKFIRSRSACQIVLEIPLERAADFIAAFGAPNPGIETPVAIARLDPNKAKAVEAEPEPAPAPAPVKDRTKWDELPASARAAMRCNNPEFQKFIGATSIAEAASIVRSRCGITSRSELSINNVTAMREWNDLDDSFIVHMRGYEEMVR